jgi:hypothetical protein
MFRASAEFSPVGCGGETVGEWELFDCISPLRALMMSSDPGL